MLIFDENGLPIEYQSPSGPPCKAECPVESEVGPDFLIPPPPAVAVALSFVEMCNNYTIPRGWVIGDQVEYLHPELNHKQEAALLQACQMLGEYFNKERKK